MNRRYVEKRKIRKVYRSKVLEFMKMFKIDKRIAEALNGSFDKTENLTVSKIETFWLVTEIKTRDSFYVRDCDGWSCSCGKLISFGIPWSHIMKILINQNTLIDTLGQLISSRWILSNFSLNKFQKEQSKDI